MLRLPITVLEEDRIGDHYSLHRDQLTYRDRLGERQKWPCHLVRAHHTATTPRLSRANDEIAESLHHKPLSKAGNWVWVYNGASTVFKGSTVGSTSLLPTKNALSTGLDSIKCRW